MRFSQALYVKANTNAHQFKRLWKNYKYKDHPVLVPEPLKDVPIIKPRFSNDIMGKRKQVIPKHVRLMGPHTDKFIADQSVDEVNKTETVKELKSTQPVKEATVESVSVSKEEEKKGQEANYPKHRYAFFNQTILLEGRKQALMLAKCQEFDGMPDSVKACMDQVSLPNMDTLIQKFIMKSQVWDTSRTSLPRRIDKENIAYRFPTQYGIRRERAMLHLLQDLVRVCVITADQFDTGEIKDRKLFLGPFLNTHYRFKGEVIRMKAFSEMMIASRKTLQPFGDSELVNESREHELESIYPVDPLIDLKQEISAKKDILSEEDMEKYRAKIILKGMRKPHTLIHLNKDLNKAVHRQNRALMYLMGYAIACARKCYGLDVKELPKPISLQCVNMNETTLNFAFFQLNTLDFTTDSGVKNFVWFDSDNRLFAKHFPKPWKGKEYSTNRYDSYDPTPVKKLLAVILNGLIKEESKLKPQEMEMDPLEIVSMEKEQMEIDPMEKDAMEIEQMVKEQMEKEKMEIEPIEEELVERDSMVKEQMEKEKMEMESIEKEPVEKKRIKRDFVDTEQILKEQTEKIEMVQMEKEPVEKEQMEKDPVEKEQMEMGEIEKMEKEPVDKEQMEKELLEKEKELLRKEKELLEKEKELLKKEKEQKENKD